MSLTPERRAEIRASIDGLGNLGLQGADLRDVLDALDAAEAEYKKLRGELSAIFETGEHFRKENARLRAELEQADCYRTHTCMRCGREMEDADEMDTCHMCGEYLCGFCYPHGETMCKKCGRETNWNGRADA